jgi:hypothetical protein
VAVCILDLCIHLYYTGGILVNVKWLFDHGVVLGWHRFIVVMLAMSATLFGTLFRLLASVFAWSDLANC